MNEAYIQRQLYYQYHMASIAILPNTYLVNSTFEADLIRITKGGYVEEFEIKTNKEDLRRDFRNKEPKHRQLETKTVMVKTSRNGQLIYEDAFLPNKYWFVIPETMLEFSKEIPIYAGIITIQDNGRVGIYRKAPPIHRNKASGELLLRLLASYSRKFWK